MSNHHKISFSAAVAPRLRCSRGQVITLLGGDSGAVYKGLSRVIFGGTASIDRMASTCQASTVTERWILIGYHRRGLGIGALNRRLL